MQPRELFGIIVRSIGLVCLLYGANQLLVWLAFETGHRTTLEHGVRMHGVAYSVLGLGVIRAAELIVRFAYPGPSQ